MTFIRVWLFLLSGLLILDAAFIYYFTNSLMIPVVLILVSFGLVWLSVRSLTQAPSIKEGMYIGRGIDIEDPDKPIKGVDVRISNKALALGSIVLGSPGGGKSKSGSRGIMQYLYEKQVGFSYFEGKGNLEEYQILVEGGINFDAFFSPEVSGSDTINLFDGESRDITDLFTNIFIGHTASTTYYADTQAAILTNFIKMLKTTGQAANLIDLYYSLKFPIAGLYALRLARNNGLDPIISAEVEEFIRSEDRLSLIQGVLNRMHDFVHGDLALRINDYSPSINLDDFIENGKRAYFHFPYTKVNRSVAVAILERINVIGRGRQLLGSRALSEYHIVMDDWGKFIHSGFGAISARLRAAKMPLHFLFQSAAQMDEVSPTFRNELSDMAAVKIVFRCHSSDTAKYGASFFGSYQKMVSQLSEGDINRSNFGEMQAPRVLEQDVQRLVDGEAFIKTLDDGTDDSAAYFKVRYPFPSESGNTTIGFPDMAKTPDFVSGLALKQKFSGGMPDNGEQKKSDQAQSLKNTVVIEDRREADK